MLNQAEQRAHDMLYSNSPYLSPPHRTPSPLKSHQPCDSNSEVAGFSAVASEQRVPVWMQPLRSYDSQSQSQDENAAPESGGSDRLPIGMLEDAQKVQLICLPTPLQRALPVDRGMPSSLLGSGDSLQNLGIGNNFANVCCVC